MHTIHIRTIAYNAEKTLRRTIESVLAQTYKNYKYYVVDNGSTDGTRAIIDEYAEKGLIIPFYNEKNHVWVGESVTAINLNKNIPEGDFYTTLDADDELFPDFFETLITFAIENDLEIAAANFEMINPETGETAPGAPVLENDVFLCTPDSFKDHYRKNMLYFRQTWGKLYNSNAAANSLFDFSKTMNGRDMIGVLQSLTVSNRIGIKSGKPLMRYYVSRGSLANSYDEYRHLFPEMIFNVLCNFISAKAGELSSDNYTFAYIYFCTEFKELLRIHLYIDIPTDTKLDEILYLFDTKTCRELYKEVDLFEIAKNPDSGLNVFKPALEWVLKNINVIQPPRVLELYMLFFDVAYGEKPVKFTENEIKLLLATDIRLANSVLCGMFDGAIKMITSLRDSNIKKSILGKILKLKG
jgi:glycosyltransferase involved in cell wall biosynthesis